MTEQASMDGKVCMVTGSNSGIGKAAAKGLARLKSHIIMVCRNPETGGDALTEIKEETGNENVELMIADLSSLKNIRNLVSKFKQKHDKLDVLINNAGVSLRKRIFSVDGFEMHFAVNYLAPFLLTNLLLDVLKASAPSRIINVSSAMHKFVSFDLNDLQNEKKFGPFGLKAYGRSKTALNLFTFELARRLEADRVTVNCLHPGGIKSNIGRHMPWYYKVANVFLKKPEKGAETIIYLASSSEVENVTGNYYVKCKEAEASPESHEESVAKQLWDISADLTGLNR